MKNVKGKRKIDIEKAKMHHMVSIHYLLFTGNDQLYYWTNLPSRKTPIVPKLIFKRLEKLVTECTFKLNSIF